MATDIKTVLAITKALADENRLRALHALTQGELCSANLMKVLELAPSTVSKHMSVLRQANLVQVRRDGRWTYYRLPGRKADKQVKQVIAWVKASVSPTDRARSDNRRVRSVLGRNRKRPAAVYRAADTA